MIYQSLEENELVGNNGYMDDEFKEKRKVYADKKKANNGSWVLLMGPGFPYLQEQE